MERDYEQHVDLIDLGAASAETQGPGVQIGDEFLGLVAAGLSED